jgi:hypothetical protein
MEKVFNILDFFAEKRYSQIVEIVDTFYKRHTTIQELNLTVSELSAITHSYLEVERFETAIVFGKYTIGFILKEEANAAESYNVDLALVIVDVIVCYQHRKQPLKAYFYILKYRDLGFKNSRVETMVNTLEFRFSQLVIKMLNGICFVYIGITYFVDPTYRHTAGYFVFILLFFIHLAWDFLKPEAVSSFYAKLIRNVVSCFL